MPFLSPADSSWTTSLRTLRHDFYHLPAYVELCARWEGGDPKAFYYERDGDLCLVPLLIRETDAGVKDATSPYGYPSPLFSPFTPLKFQREALEAFSEEASAVGLTSTFLRLHPLLQPDLPTSEGWSTIIHGPTVSIDTRKGRETWFEQLSSNHRRNVRKLQRLGYTVTFDEHGTLETFGEIYRATMDRVDAADNYFFSDHYFAELRDALGHRWMLATVRSANGEVAAAGLFACTASIAQYHLGGTHPDHLNLAPSKLMFVEAREEAARRGADRLHLGGGLGSRRDALFKFKSGFAGEEHVFASARFIHNPHRYDYLTRERLGLGTHDVLPKVSFFPLYRLPI